MPDLKFPMYAVVAESDYDIKMMHKNHITPQQIVFEGCHFSLESAKKQQKMIGKRFGKTVIVELIPIQNEEQ